jgi:hypothetical protein
MFNKLMDAAEAAKNTAPVETTLFFDTDGVWYRMRVELRGKDVFVLHRKLTWAQLDEIQACGYQGG